MLSKNNRSEDGTKILQKKLPFKPEIFDESSLPKEMPRTWLFEVRKGEMK